MTHNADLERLYELAYEAWHADTSDGPASEVYWDSDKDCWIDGFATGYRAALAALIDGTVADG